MPGAATRANHREAHPAFTASATAGCSDAPAIAPGEVVGLAVAVRAEQTQILEPVVEAVSVHVMQCQGKRPAPPGLHATLLTSRRFEPRIEQAELDVVAPPIYPRDQELLERSVSGPGVE